MVEFDRANSPLARDTDWRIRRDWPIWTSGAIPSTELWAWVMTRRTLTRSLAEALEQRRLSYVADEALGELAWEFGLEVSSGPWRRESRPSIAAVFERIRQLPDDHRTTLRTGNRVYTWNEIEIVRDHLRDLERHGNDILHDPWPTADLPRARGFRRSQYSDQRLLERTTAIYSAALKIYQRMVECWFRSFSARLSLYRLLPVRFEGLVTRRTIGDTEWPGLWWRPIILPRGQDSDVDFHFGQADEQLLDIESHFEEQRDAYVRLREGNADDGVIFYSGGSALDLISSRPATDLAHRWLADELKDLRWVESIVI